MEAASLSVHELILAAKTSRQKKKEEMKLNEINLELKAINNNEKRQAENATLATQIGNFFSEHQSTIQKIEKYKSTNFLANFLHALHFFENNSK